MKHIKSKKLFESHPGWIKSRPNLILDIKDICLELEQDLGYQLSINHPSSGSSVSLRKEVGKWPDNKYDNFNYNDISEYVERIKDYLGDTFLNIEVSSVLTNFKWVTANGDLSNQKIVGIKINFKK